MKVLVEDVEGFLFRVTLGVPDCAIEHHGQSKLIQYETYNGRKTGNFYFEVVLTLKGILARRNQLLNRLGELYVRHQPLSMSDEILISVEDAQPSLT